MNTRLKLAFVAASISISAQSQSNMQDYFSNPEWHECHSEMKTARIMAFPERKPVVRYIHNVVYMNSYGEDLTLQILKPDNGGKDEKYPCVIYIPGSAWMKQDVYVNLPALAEFAGRGYVVAMVEYVHSGIAPFPAQLQNIKAAIRFMRKNACMYGVDADNLFVWGDSSGGHLALMTAVTADVSEFDTDLYNEYSTAINACVSYYGISDIKSIHTDPCSVSSGKEDSPEGMLLGNVDVDEHVVEADAASPVHYVDSMRNIPPILLAVGTHDHIVPFSQTELMARTLDNAGKEYAYYVLEGADHASWEFWTPQTFDVVDRFLREHIGQ